MFIIHHRYHRDSSLLISIAIDIFGMIHDSSTVGLTINIIANSKQMLRGTSIASFKPAVPSTRPQSSLGIRKTPSEAYLKPKKSKQKVGSSKQSGHVNHISNNNNHANAYMYGSIGKVERVQLKERRKSLKELPKRVQHQPSKAKKSANQQTSTGISRNAVVPTLIKNIQRNCQILHQLHMKSNQTSSNQTSSIQPSSSTAHHSHANSSKYELEHKLSKEKEKTEEETGVEAIASDRWSKERQSIKEAVSDHKWRKKEKADQEPKNIFQVYRAYKKNFEIENINFNHTKSRPQSNNNSVHQSKNNSVHQSKNNSISAAQNYQECNANCKKQGRASKQIKAGKSGVQTNKSGVQTKSGAQVKCKQDAKEKEKCNKDVKKCMERNQKKKLKVSTSKEVGLKPKSTMMRPQRITDIYPQVKKPRLSINHEQINHQINPFIPFCHPQAIEVHSSFLVEDGGLQRPFEGHNEVEIRGYKAQMMERAQWIGNEERIEKVDRIGNEDRMEHHNEGHHNRQQAHIKFQSSRYYVAPIPPFKPKSKMMEEEDSLAGCEITLVEDGPFIDQASDVVQFQL